MRTLLCLCLIPAIGYSADQPVKLNAKVAWAWATTNADESCPGPKCQASAAWLWCTIDLPEKEVCDCGDCPCCQTGECKCKTRDCTKLDPAKAYGQLRGHAVADRKPLIVSVGCETVRVDGCLSVRFDAFSGVKGPVIVVGIPQGKELMQAAVMSCKSKPDEIKAVAFPKPKLVSDR